MTLTHAPTREGTAEAGNRAAPRPQASDDEILGIASAAGKRKYRDAAAGTDTGDPAGESGRDGGDTLEASGEPENPGEAPGANPEWKQAWSDAQAYREAFATPEKAREGAAVLADINRLDALFFSPRPEDHAELARVIAGLDPKAFASLAQAMGNEAARAPRGNVAQPEARAEDALTARAAQGAALTPEQADFFHSANAAAVQSVLDAIESQADRLLPEGMPRSARNRVVGEIYRELEGALRSNRQLAGQLREAFRSGALDAEHQRAIVSLIAGRARQALPGVAKRVLGEWTSAVVAANRDRSARQRAAERRVDIAGSGGAGNDGRRPMTPRDIDYKRMSDADILNL